MKKDIITLDGINFIRYPDSSRKELSVYYCGGVKDRKVRLHRYLYEKHIGPIPKGHIIHHKDGNPLNNCVSNLECMSASKHASLHMLEPERVKKSRETIKIAREHANKWHGSAEGHLFHKELARKQWQNKELHTKQCEQCGGDYETYFPTRSKYCSGKCKATGLRRRRGTAPRKFKK